MITIGQIAKMAGVSKSTVSRVLNSSGYVHEDTRKKIEEIMREYHYSPSASAQNLSRRETNTIGIIVPEIDNLFYTEVLSGASETAAANNYTVLVCNTGNDEKKEEAALNMMEHQRVSGVIFAPSLDFNNKSDVLSSVRKQLINLHVPVVVVDREIDNVPWDGVFYENFQSTYLGTEHLIKAGCKSIGIITGDLRQKHANDRYLGYCHALEEYGIALDKKWVYEGDFTIHTACRLTEGIIQKDEWPDGMLLTNNCTTLGFLKSLRSHGMNLGDKTKVMCIDHVQALDLLGYRYECVTRDMPGMGRVAMELLMERLNTPAKERKIAKIPCITRFFD